MSLGPEKLSLYIETLLYQGPNIIKNTKRWDQENYLVITRSCYISALYNEVGLYIPFFFKGEQGSFQASMLKKAGGNTIVKIILITEI